MISAFLKGPNQEIILQEFNKPVPGKGEAIVQIHYAALNHRDLWTLKGQYRGSSENLILGSDGSGILDSLGETAQTRLEIGQEVIINPSLNWGENENAQGPDFQILGNPDPGTFSQYIKVPMDNIFPLPKGMSLMEGAALPLAGLTAYRALFTRGKLKKGQNLLITGIGGGAAQLGFQMAKAIGARVFISSSKISKITESIQEGAEEGFDYTQSDWVKNAQKSVPEGFDLIMDSASGKGFPDLIDLLKPGGSFVFFGGTAGPWASPIPAKIFWKQINILGTTMGSPKEFQELIQFFEEYSLHPKIDQIFPLSNINQAFRRMESGEQTGKILLKIH